MIKLQDTNRSQISNTKFGSWSLFLGHCLVLGACFLVILSASTFALSINIDPSNIKLIMKPGETKTGEIVVQNSGSSPIRVKAYMEDWAYEGDGSKSFAKAGTLPYSCSSWIKLDDVTFTLSAKEDKKVKYTITAPEKISGGHVSVIFFEIQSEVKEGISVSGRIGTIIYIDTEGNIDRNGELKGITVIGTTEGDEIKVNTSLINKGNTYLLAKLKLTITKDDKTILEMPLRPINCLPGNTANMQITLKEPLLEGKYKAKAEVTYEDKTLKADTEFAIKKSSR